MLYNSKRKSQQREKMKEIIEVVVSLRRERSGPGQRVEEKANVKEISGMPII